ncbi:hypothetical protein N9C19_00265 [bacterium]|jgi:hypothetical protein|nr:hypothetical protein [bacterium]
MIHTKKMRPGFHRFKILLLSLFIFSCNSKEDDKINRNFIYLTEAQKNMICACASLKLEIFTQIQNTIGENKVYSKSDSLKAFEIISRFKSKSENCNKFNLELSEKKRAVASEYLMTCEDAKILDSLLK